MARIHLTIVVLAVLATIASAAVPSFCKCTCFQNSTIIPLGPQDNNNNNPVQPPPKPSTASSHSSLASESTNTPSDPNPDPNSNPDTNNPDTSPTTRTRTLRSANPLNPLHHLLLPRESSTSCKQCNRAFCLKYNLPICKDAEEKDIKTTCFQRDSHKDQVIVWGFILGTAGLLGWAAVRRVVDSARERRSASGSGSGMGAGTGRLAGLAGGFMDGGSGGGVGGGNGSGRGTGLLRRTGSGGGGRADRGVYDPLEDVHDEGVVRGPG